MSQTYKQVYSLAVFSADLTQSHNNTNFTFQHYDMEQRSEKAPVPVCNSRQSSGHEGGAGGELSLLALSVLTTELLLQVLVHGQVGGRGGDV